MVAFVFLYTKSDRCNLLETVVFQKLVTVVGFVTDGTVQCTTCCTTGTYWYLCLLVVYPVVHGILARLNREQFHR